MTETMTMTMAAYARRHGVSRVCTGKWAKRGIVVMTADGLVDVHKSDKRLAGRPERYRGGKAKDKSRRAVKVSTEPKSAGLAAAIERKELALAALREHELAVKSGRFAEVEYLAQLVEGVFAVVRERAMCVPGNLADAIAMQPREVCFDLLRGEINEMLTELSDGAADELAKRAAEETRDGK